MNTNKFEIINEWSVGSVQITGSPLIIRLRNKLNSVKGKEIFPHLLRMSWIFQTPVEMGMPSKAESEELSKFEDCLTSVVEHNIQSVLTTVITRDGFREWYFYTENIDEFMKCLCNVPHQNSNHPVEVYFINNENWRFYDDIKLGNIPDMVFNN